MDFAKIGYRWAAAALFCFYVAGCSETTLPGDVGDIVKFHDQAPANTQVGPEEVSKIVLRHVDGTETSIDKLHAGKPLVLVVTRGIVGSDTGSPNEQAGAGGICTYCSTQVSRLIANYGKFQKAKAEVVVVFPVVRAKDQNEVQKFAARVQGPSKTTKDCPFPILLDVELHAVDALGIRADLSKPSTYIIDTQGKVRYAYVGNSAADRPSVKALLEQLAAISG